MFIKLNILTLKYSESISSSQWNTYVKKLKLVSNTAKLVHKQNESIEVKEIPGLIVSPGSQPVTLQMPTVLEINVPDDVSGII